MTTPGHGVAERLVRRDRAVVLCGAGAVILLAAVYAIAGVGLNMSAIRMTGMAGPPGLPMPMGEAPRWTATYAAVVFLMWWAMMIAMMTPSAAPALLLYGAVKRMGPEGAAAPRLSAVFLAGYLIAWGAFSAAATALQWGLEGTGLLDGSMMALASRGAAGAALILAGCYQVSPLKRACLRHCRSPAQFIARHNRPGPRGALRLGLRHGAYCLGCCWALMALLFAGGIMNLYWIAGIAAYVALEKLVPRADWLVPLSGALLFGGGAWLVLDAALMPRP